MKILVAVTHLLGAGHLTRAATLARACQDAGHEVLLVSGGVAAPHIMTDDLSLVQLPAVRSDGLDFSTLLDGEGQPVFETWLKERRSFAVKTVRDFRPDVLITELFPFGRRQLAREFLEMLEAGRDAQPGLRILSSVRDILAPPSTDKKAKRTTDILLSYYDGVLVHSDPSIIPLEQSWPVDPAWAGKLRYTGFITAASDIQTVLSSATKSVIVSAGGGPVGHRLYAMAVEAAREMPDCQWRLLVGGTDAKALCTELMSAGLYNVIVEPARPDFRALLAAADVSVSMCGYNTSLDLLISGTPALIVPFDAGGETEQSLRANGLAKLPGFDVLKDQEMTAEAMITHVRRLLDHPKRPASGINLNGAAGTVAILEDLVKA